MNQEEVLDLVNAIKGYCNYDITIYYPIISYMCRNGYIKDWKCIDDTFYVNGKGLA